MSYSWEFLPTGITFTPTTGCIPALATTVATVTVTPQPGMHTIHSSVSCRVDGGESVPVSISATCPVATCHLNNKRVDFGPIPVGNHISKTFTIVNTSHVPAVYVVNSCPPLVHVEPPQARISPDSSKELTVSVCVPSVGPFEETIHFNLRSGKGLRLTVYGEARSAKVTIDPPNGLTLPSAVIGGHSEATLKMHNTDCVAATVSVDLSQYTEITLVESSHVTKSANCIYTIAVPPESTVDIAILFNPISVGCHAFRLPACYTSGHEVPSLEISATGENPRIIANPTHIDFGSVKVGSTCEHSLTLTSCTETKQSEPLEWSIDTSEIESMGITVFPKSGVLSSKGKFILKLRFSPSESVPRFDTVVPVCVRGVPYISIRVSGEASPPYISVDPVAVTLPIVPLNHEATATLTICNHGFDSSVAHLTAELDSGIVLPITVALPDGASLSRDHHSVPLHVSFTSSRPISIVSRIRITATTVDLTSTVFVPIVAVADNSVCTRSISSEPTCLLAYLGIPTAVIPSDFFDGKLFPDLIDRLTGKPGGFAKWCKTQEKRGSTTSNAPVPSTRRCESVVQYVVAHGGLVGDTVKAEYLQAPSGEPTTARNAIICLLFQIVKITRRLAPLAGDTLSDVHSATEVVLLRWLQREAGWPSVPIKSFTNVKGVQSVLLKIVQTKMPYLDGITVSSRSDSASLRASMQELAMADFGDLSTATERDFVLLVLYLYEQLPLFTPSGPPIEFVTPLSVQATHIGDVKVNTRTTAVRYYPRLYGDADSFTIPDSVEVPSTGDVSVEISHRSRFNRPTACTLHLLAAGFSPVVITLTSRVNGIHPLTVTPVRAQILKPSFVEIEIRNPFSEDGEFRLTVVDSDFVFCKLEKIVLTGGACHAVQFTVIGLTPVTVPVRTLVRCMDDLVGEFYYGIDVTITPPPPPTIPSLKLRCKAGEEVTGEFLIESCNADFESARTLIDSLSSRIPVTSTAAEYTVSITSTSFELDKSVLSFKSSPRPVALRIHFRPKLAGTYSAIIAVSSKDETRTFLREGIAVGENQRVNLRFETFARCPVSQEIPVVNQAATDCVYKPVLHSTDSDVGRFVTCLSSEFVVNAGGTSAYPLEFSPRWMCSGSVILELRNVTTGETVEYHIEMVAKEPLSEGHIRIPCTARELTEHSIQVPNFTHHSHGVRSSRIKVETDLLDVFGTESVVVVLSTLTEFTYVLQV